MSRREFLKWAGTAAGTTVGAAVSLGGCSKPASGEVGITVAALPTFSLGKHTLTRLIAGWNPIGGFSHSVPNLSQHMREYFTSERVDQFLLDVEKSGINCWQLSHGTKAKAACETLKKRGSKLKILVLHAERSQDEPLETVIADTGCIGISHHGNVTDALFRNGKFNVVRDYLKKVRDAGVLAGVSSHCPENIKRIADEGWDVDYFMTCFYYVTRPREEIAKALGGAFLDEPFLDSDPGDMARVIAQVDKPCLAFKILAAGRNCSNAYSVEKAFRYAFENIKPVDGVIVGMYPRFKDEIAENVKLAQKYG